MTYLTLTRRPALHLRRMTHEGSAIDDHCYISDEDAIRTFVIRRHLDDLKANVPQVLSQFLALSQTCFKVHLLLDVHQIEGRLVREGVGHPANHCKVVPEAGLDTSIIHYNTHDDVCVCVTPVN